MDRFRFQARHRAGIWFALALTLPLGWVAAVCAQPAPVTGQKLQERPVIRQLPKFSLQCKGKVCLAAGGLAEEPHGSPTVCVADDDPAYGCGSCRPCILFQVEGAFCGARGCDFRTCKAGWADQDGNRANGCERSISLSTRTSSHRASIATRSCTQRAECAQGQECVGSRCVSAQCTHDRECDDGVFCNGRERCEPGRAGADSRGCKPQPAVQCGPYQICSETTNACQLADSKAADRDGDGSLATWAGGDDCDDFDGKRAPLLIEVCDDQGHDEDCDPQTFGARDRDRDGASDATCCNYRGKARYCGDDCDDTQAAVRVSSIVCEGDKPLMCVARDSPTEGRYAELESTSCASGSSCVSQPNGVGVCR